MSFWNISLEVEVYNASGIRNDFGTIRGGGNIFNVNKFSSDPVSLGINTKIDIAYIDGVTKAFPSGIENSNNQMIQRVTRSIAGENNDALYYASSNAANRKNSSINQVTSSYVSLYKTLVRDGRWHEASGEFISDFNVVNSGLWSQGSDSDVSNIISTSPVDKASNPTKTEFGRLTYQDGSANPIQDAYPGISKNNSLIFEYLRPGGIGGYLRSDGVSTYKRPA